MLPSARCNGAMVNEAPESIRCASEMSQQMPILRATVVEEEEEEEMVVVVSAATASPIYGQSKSAHGDSQRGRGRK